MYKSMGAAGVDIGSVHDYGLFVKILRRAKEIGDDWRGFKDNLYWPMEGGFYLYDDAGQQVRLSKGRMKLRQRFFNLVHRTMLNPQHLIGKVFKKTLACFGIDKGKGCFYKLFNCIEKVFKYLLFDCQECGDCFLAENFGWCTIGGCEKGMDNAPCGDSTADGYCGNNLERLCIGEYIYNSAAAEDGGLEKLRGIINKPRDPLLEHTASIVNYFFGKDHAMKNLLISIGEAVHASIPKTGKIMKELAELGGDAYSKPSEPLNYIRALIESQADDGADYIAVNLDAYGESDPQVTIDMMVEYVKLVRQYGGGVPICIDSSDDNVLIAGLKEWYNSDKSVKQPLIN